MKIKSLQLDNFRCFKNLQLSFDENLTVIVAANGAGKTTVLEGLVTALGAYITAIPKAKGVSFKDSDLLVLPDGTSPDFVGVKAETTAGLQWDRFKRNPLAKKQIRVYPGWSHGEKQLKAYVTDLLSNEGVYPIIAYYSVNRFASSGTNKQPYNQHNVEWYDGYKNALDIKMSFKDLVIHMASLEDAQRREREKLKSFDYHSPALQTIRQVLGAILPEISNFRTELKEQIVLVADFTDNNGTKTLTMDQLSSGYQVMLALVLDITLRLLALNHKNSDSLNGTGIVLIDEIDLHLHPRWQQIFISQLRSVFPNIQFIITTHSPQVISTVDSDCIRILENGNVYASPRGTRGAEASRILKRVFDVEVRPPHDENTIKLEKYMKLVYDDMWEQEEAQALRAELDAVFEDEEPRLTEADMYIENRQWELEVEEDL